MKRTECQDLASQQIAMREGLTEVHAYNSSTSGSPWPISRPVPAWQISSWVLEMIYAQETFIPDYIHLFTWDMIRIF